MNEEMIIELIELFFNTTMLLCAPVVITVVVVGLVIQVIQTVTQLKDQAIAFVPKIFAVGIIYILLTPWYIQILQHFTERIMSLMEGVATL